MHLRVQCTVLPLLMLLLTIMSRQEAAGTYLWRVLRVYSQRIAGHVLQPRVPEVNLHPDRVLVAWPAELAQALNGHHGAMVRAALAPALAGGGRRDRRAAGEQVLVA